MPDPEEEKNQVPARESGEQRLADKHNYAGDERYRQIVVDGKTLAQPDGEEFEEGVGKRGDKDKRQGHGTVPSVKQQRQIGIDEEEEEKTQEKTGRRAFQGFLADLDPSEADPDKGRHRIAQNEEG